MATASWQTEYAVLVDALLSVVSRHTRPEVGAAFLRRLRDEVSARRHRAMAAWQS